MDRPIDRSTDRPTSEFCEQVLVEVVLFFYLFSPLFFRHRFRPSKDREKEREWARDAIHGSCTANGSFVCFVYHSLSLLLFMAMVVILVYSDGSSSPFLSFFPFFFFRVVCPITGRQAGRQAALGVDRPSSSLQVPGCIIEALLCSVSLRQPPAPSQLAPPAGAGLCL